MTPIFVLIVFFLCLILLIKSFVWVLDLVILFLVVTLFYKADCHSNESKRAHCHKLDELVFEASNEPNTVVVISNASINNNVITSIAHIHSFNQVLKKTLHHAINVTFMKVELFVL